jgi:Tfp pilus assembly protein PilV
MKKVLNGFTIMETTLALTLLTVGMLSLTGVFSQIVTSNTVIKRKQTAVLLATTKLNQLRTMPITEISELKGTFDEPFQHYSWEARFNYQLDNGRVADIWLEIKHKSGTAVKLCTRILITNGE